MFNTKFLIPLLVGLLFTACQSKPKVIESEPIAATGNGVPDYHDSSVLVKDADPDMVHQVKVVETLNTERYTYLNVSENERTFWIAIPKKEVEVGATYYYKGGLLKQNFFSQEYNRVFEELYLVSDVSPHPLGSEAPALAQAMANVGTAVTDGPIKIDPVEGAIKIAELMSNRSKYEGKVVKITGKCVKVNPMIMGRNWVHLQDGSGENMDLTVTTQESIPIGAVVSMEGTIALNKDFGAGYRYEVIMEGAAALK